jgi:CubicO group peptidase (beta-lactamase class C family)
MNVSDMTIHAAGVFMGNAGLIATSADFAVFIEALLDGHVIGQESLAEMLEPTKSLRYGLGLHFTETPYGLGIGHNGSDFGVLSEVRRFPDVDATLVLLVNGGDSGITARLFNRLWDEAMQTALGGVADVSSRGAVGWAPLPPN